MSLYFSLSLYILSLLGALVLVITGKNQRPAWIKSALVLHCLSLLLFLVYLLQGQGLPPGSPFRFAFLAVLCSGLLAGGFILRSEWPKALKLYTSLYFLSVVFFLVSPSRFAAALSRGDLDDASPKRFHVLRNFYLEEQHASFSDTNKPKNYKLVQQFGIFHRTIQRDISFESDPDSLRLRKQKSSQIIKIIVYFHRSDTASTVPYSREITLSLAPNKTDPIQRIHY